ncbi:flagellar motor protein MotB [Fictibacillus gelatini]|uniref:flagellar motor protein MotB n=1 Tax=Fictibacillus gelatini TaxID=225985 RepID=UPI00040830BF|nr:flagellar motor protein MotB [Fictibacillus gelatini]
MAKKKKKKDDHIDESWLIPYADLLTLLLALFIVLFAMSEIDASKFKQMASAFRNQFNGGTGIMEEQAPVPPETPSIPEKEKNDHLTKEDHERLEKAKKELESLQRLQEKLDHFISDNHLNKSLQTELTENGLLITILNNALFDSGSATVKPGSVKLAKKLSKLLVTHPARNIVIAGHTDNVPIKTSQYPSNWELSAMRAVNFMRILIENPELPPKSVSASGYGEYHPKASNQTEDGRAKNRRVEVLILPNYDIKKAK